MDIIGVAVLAFVVIGLGLIVMAMLSEAKAADDKYDAMMRAEREALADTMIQEYHASENAKVYQAWLAQQNYTPQEVEA